MGQGPDAIVHRVQLSLIFDRSGFASAHGVWGRDLTPLFTEYNFL
jgi:hypothetical protein